MDADYPEELLRGIPRDSPEYISEEGYPTQAVFKFDKYNASSRNDDGFCELSVNWYDDEGAIDTLLGQINQRKGLPQFQGGYCKISRSVMHLVFKEYFGNQHLSYERRPIDIDHEAGITGNPYHGNLLMRDSLSKSAKTNVQATLATIAGTAYSRSL